MKTSRNRFVLEAAAASLLMLAAHAVYAIDHIVGSMAFTGAGENAMRIELLDRTDARVPAPVQVRVDRLINDRSFFCLDLGLKDRAFGLDIPADLHLVSEVDALPYQLEFAGTCETASEIGFDLVVDETARSLLASRVFADTVIVSVNPE